MNPAASFDYGRDVYLVCAHNMKIKVVRPQHLDKVTATFGRDYEERLFNEASNSLEQLSDVWDSLAEQQS